MVNGPDLNPIEMLLGDLKRAVHYGGRELQNKLKFQETKLQKFKLIYKPKTLHLRKQNLQVRHVYQYQTVLQTVDADGKCGSNTQESF